MNKNTTDSNTTRKVVGVKFREGGKTYFFSPNGLDLEVGDSVIVETIRGLEFAFVSSPVVAMQYEKFPSPLKNIVRRATSADESRLKDNSVREKEAFLICEEKIAEHNLAMQLINCEYSFEGTRITLSFVSENRVDFRALVRDLASIFHTRIELRQIGVRDKAKMLGGVGACGRTICCSSFLHSFTSVSIKMAKDQNIALSPTKISGICGRLMCCLKYEQEAYEAARKKMPQLNLEIITPDGPGTVIENNVLTEKTKVKLLLDDGSFDIREYPLAEIKFTQNCPCRATNTVTNNCVTCKVAPTCKNPSQCEACKKTDSDA